MAKTNGTEVSDDGFTEQQTLGELTGEWLTPEKGLTIIGKLGRAFIFTSVNGTDAAYSIFGRVAILDDKGVEKKVVKNSEGQENCEWLLSERVAYADSIRQLRKGTTVKLAFLAKENIINKKTKKPGNPIWRCKLGAKNDGTGEPMRDMLNREAMKIKQKAAMALALAPKTTDENDVAF